MRYPTSPVLPAPCFPFCSWGCILLLGTALVLGLASGRALGSDAQPAAPPSKTNLLAVGQQAPDFVARDLNEQARSLEVYQGHPLILNFWATWCVPCRHEMSLLQTVYEMYQDAGLVILAVSQDTQDRVDTVRAYMTTSGLTFPALQDPQGAVASSYNVLLLPSTFFINAQGVVIAIHRGPITPAQIERYVMTIVTPQK